MLLEQTQGLEFSVATFVTLAVGIAVNRLVAFFQALKMKKDQKAALSLLHTQVQGITAELQTNGGSSMKDVINKNNDTLTKCLADINEVKISIKKLTITQKIRLETLMNQMSGCLFICDETGAITFANKAMLELYGMSYLGHWQSLKAIVDEHTRQRVKTDRDSAARNKIPYRDEYEIINQINGDKHCIITIIDPVLDSDGNLVQFIGTVKTKDK